MHVHYQRALILFHQSRPELAEEELRRELAINPDSALAHGLLASCFRKRGKLDEAEQSARKAVGLDPQLPYTHHVLAMVLSDRNRLAEAETAIREAIRLNPACADYFAVLARVKLMAENWEGALDAANQGLCCQPEHTDCNNCRALALINLGRIRTARATLDTNLTLHPNNADTHAHQGWTLLAANHPEKAQEHFQEALRLSPAFDWARAGVVEAHKACLPINRFFPVARRGLARMGVLSLVGVPLSFVLAYGMGWQSWLAVYLILLEFLLVYAFCSMAVPDLQVLNLFLRLKRNTRLSLSRDQIIGSNCVGGCLLVAVAALFSGLLSGEHVLVLFAAVAVVFTLPVASIFNCAPGWPRRFMTIYTIILVLLCFATPLVARLGFSDLAAVTLALFVIGMLGAGGVGGNLVRIRPTR